jgi:hypothetical protein
MDISGTKFDFSNVDYDAIQAKMSMQIKDILAKPLNLFWNSHTGEIYSSCKPVPPSAKVNTTLMSTLAKRV